MTTAGVCKGKRLEVALAVAFHVSPDLASLLFPSFSVYIRYVLCTPELLPAQLGAVLVEGIKDKSSFQWCQKLEDISTRSIECSGEVLYSLGGLLRFVVLDAQALKSFITLLAFIHFALTTRHKLH